MYKFIFSLFLVLIILSACSDSSNESFQTNEDTTQRILEAEKPSHKINKININKFYFDDRSINADSKLVVMAEIKEALVNVEKLDKVIHVDNTISEIPIQATHILSSQSIVAKAIKDGVYFEERHDGSFDCYISSKLSSRYLLIDDKNHYQELVQLINLLDEKNYSDKFISQLFSYEGKVEALSDAQIAKYKMLLASYKYIEPSILDIVVSDAQTSVELEVKNDEGEKHKIPFIYESGAWKILIID